MFYGKAPSHFLRVPTIPMLLFRASAKEIEVVRGPGDLKHLQSLVGGYIEFVPNKLDAHAMCVAYVNEDGRALCLKANATAREKLPLLGFIGQEFLGDVIVAYNKEDEATGDVLPFKEEHLELLERVLKCSFERADLQ